MCQNCKSFKEKIKHYWDKSIAFLKKKTWGAPNYVWFVLFPLVITVGIISLIPRKKYK